MVDVEEPDKAVELQVEQGNYQSQGIRERNMAAKASMQEIETGKGSR